MATVNTLARDLGLRPSSVAVLDALLSCLPCNDPKTGKDMPVTPSVLLTVFAANDTLCFRAKGLSDRQLRRHINGLERLGLLTRRDSANGKRFPIYQGGRIVGAFGIDLSPLFEQAATLLQRAEQKRQDVLELKGLKSRIQRVRLDCQGLHLPQSIIDFLNALPTVLRRKSLTLTEGRALLKRLETIVQQNTDQGPTTHTTPTTSPRTTDQMSGTDGQNDRHIETPKSDTKKISRKEDDHHGDPGPAPIDPHCHQSSCTSVNAPAKTGQLRFENEWRRLTCLPQFYSDIPKTENELHRILYEFGQFLGLNAGLLSDAIAKGGPVWTMKIQDQIGDRLDKISNVPGYFRRMLSLLSPKTRVDALGT